MSEKEFEYLEADESDDYCSVCEHTWLSWCCQECPCRDAPMPEKPFPCKNCEKMKAEPEKKMGKKTPIWGSEGYVNSAGEICHKTVIVGYEEPENKKKEP